MTAPFFRLWFDTHDPDSGAIDPRRTSAQPTTPASVSTRPAETDVAVIAQLRAGDIPTFEAVYRDFAPRLFQFAARYVHARDLAEDVVQDVFHTFWEHHTTVEIHTSVAAYLYGAVRFRALRVRQEHRRDDTLPAHLGDAVSSAPPPSTDASAESSTFDGAVQAIINRTHHPARDVLYLRWAHHMSYDDIAAALGISAPAARQHVHRLLRRLGPSFRRLLE